MSQNEQAQVVSYTTLRRTLGIIGITFPIVLLIGSLIIDNCAEVQSSISNYYHTRMGNVFVGYLCSIGLFLWAYKGYPGAKWDNIAGNIACVLALTVAFLPTAVTSFELTTCLTSEFDNGIVGILHIVAACLFLIVLASFSLFIFTKGSATPTPNKRKRNILYKICGYSMLGCILLMGVYIIFFRATSPELEKISPVYWLEAIALWAFGLSWLTKGGLLLKDN